MPSNLTSIERIQLTMPSTPGWVNTLAGGVPGVIAAYDFINKLYWQLGNPSGGLIVASGTPKFMVNGLYVDGTYSLSASKMSNFNGLSGSMYAKTYQCTSFDAICTLASKQSLGGFLDISATQTSLGSGIPFLALGAGQATLGSGNITSGTCKRVLSFDPSGCSIAANGSATTAIGNTFPVVSYGIGFTPGTINGYLQAVVVWPSRLPDATLKTLSTLP
jgi:hypothetical protein